MRPHLANELAEVFRTLENLATAFGHLFDARAALPVVGAFRDCAAASRALPVDGNMKFAMGRLARDRLAPGVIIEGMARCMRLGCELAAAAPVDPFQVLVLVAPTSRVVDAFAHATREFTHSDLSSDEPLRVALAARRLLDRMRAAVAVAEEMLADVNRPKTA